MTQSTAVRLCIFLNSDDLYRRRPLGSALLARARDSGMRGASLIHASQGFGTGGVLRHTRFLSTAEKLPSMVWVIDEQSVVDAFLASIRWMLPDRTVITLEPVSLQLLRHPTRQGERP